MIVYMNGELNRYMERSRIISIEKQRIDFANTYINKVEETEESGYRAFYVIKDYKIESFADDVYKITTKKETYVKKEKEFFTQKHNNRTYTYYELNNRLYVWNGLRVSKATIETLAKMYDDKYVSLINDSEEFFKLVALADRYKESQSSIDDLLNRMIISEEEHKSRTLERFNLKRILNNGIFVLNDTGEFHNRQARTIDTNSVLDELFNDFGV